VERAACFSDDNFAALEKELKEVDFLILSPGIPRDHQLCQIVLNNKKEVIGEIEFDVFCINVDLVQTLFEATDGFTQRLTQLW
jgi:UDP-N-acetylmuramoylalanine-D-glutamate ligase